MSAHVITDDTTLPTPLETLGAGPDAGTAFTPAAAPGRAPTAATGPGVEGGSLAGWLALSAALTEQVPSIADREDLVVRIAPGAGHGSPACFLPAHATIEIDGTHLHTVDPASATPHRVSDRARYARAWGLLVHECAHARHSPWSEDGQDRKSVV